VRHPRFMNMKPQSRDVRDDWKKVDGVWYKSHQAAQAGQSPFAEMLKQMKERGLQPSPGASGATPTPGGSAGQPGAPAKPTP